MPQLPGEVSLLSLYADCHYYFSPPNSKPVHHRFDKRSYVYLYHDALRRKGRVEIANYAGTPDQDAFNGYLDTSDIEYSYKHPTLFTITVQGRVLSTQPPSSTPSPQQDISQWHLPTADVRNEGKYMFKIHTLDMYFWTIEDAELFLDSLKRVVAQGQLRILDANTTHPEHRDSMSPVVQQLEKAAIHTPVSAQMRNNSVSTNNSAAISQVSAQGPPTGHATHPPVSPAVSPPVVENQQPQPQSQLLQQQLQQQQAPLPPPPPQAQQNFSPMAYNPAAPAAPEPIAHREKTPPPPDGEAGTGLAAAASTDSQLPIHPGMQPGQQASYMTYSHPQQMSFGPQATPGPYTPGFGGLVNPSPMSNIVPGPPGMPPPSSQPLQALQRQNTLPPQSPMSGQFASSPPLMGPTAVQTVQDPNAHLYHQQQNQQIHPGLGRTPSFPMSSSPHAQVQAQPQPQVYVQQQQTPGYGHFNPATSGYVLPPGSPGFAPGQVGGPTFVPTQPSYAVQSQQAQTPANPYGVNNTMHSQVYIPEGQPAPALAGAGQASATGKPENRLKEADKKLSGRINGFLSRVEKKNFF